MALEPDGMEIDEYEANLHNFTAEKVFAEESAIAEQQQIQSFMDQTNFKSDPLNSSRSLLEKFMQEIENGEKYSEDLKENLNKKQQELLRKFVMENLELMNEYNHKMKPLQKSLSNVKKPLCDILLNKYVSLPCTSLDDVTKSKNVYSRSWGMSNWGYSHARLHDASKFEPFDLGLSNNEKLAIEKSKNENNNNNNNNNDDANANPKQNEDNNNKNNNNNNNNNNDQKMELDEQAENAELKSIFNGNANLVSEEQINLILKHFTTKRNEINRQKEHAENVKKIKELQLKKEQERNAGAETLLNIIEYLTKDQAKALLELKHDNLEEAINYAMSSDPNELIFEISQKKAEQVQKQDHEQEQDTNRHFADKRVLVRSQSTGMIKSVIFRVEDVSDDGTITLRGVLDRNTIPLNPVNAKMLKLTLAQLMAADISFVDPDLVTTYCQNRILKIVFQVMKNNNNNMIMMDDYGDIHQQGNESDQNEFIPISIQPHVREMEYKLDFNNDPPSEKSLTSVSHHVDGPVLFKGIYDDGSGLIMSQLNQPVELYTQVIDDVTHNIVMILLDDVRDNISVDVKNLSFTDATVDDCKEFNKDATGRKLAYRIIVKDKKVIAVLSPFGDEIKKLPFIEYVVPPVGSLVQLPNNQIGIVKSIPTGLIVTNNPKDIEKIVPKFERQKAVLRKHVADLQGFIDVEIVKKNGEWLENSINEGHVVTSLQEVDENIQYEYLTWKEKEKKNVKEDYVKLIQTVEDIVNNIKNKKYKGNDEAKKLLNDGNQYLLQLKQMKQNVKEIAIDNNLHQQNDSKIQRMEKELRALRYEVNMK